MEKTDNKDYTLSRQSITDADVTINTTYRVTEAKPEGENKPDFEKMADNMYPIANDKHRRLRSAFRKGCEQVWQDNLEPLDIKYALAVHTAEDRLEQIKALQQEIKTLRQQLEYYADKNQNQ